MCPRQLVCHALGLSIGLCLTVFAALLLDRKPVVLLDAGASSVFPNPAHPGDTIAITWSANPLRNCAGSVVPRIIDSTGRIYEFARIPTVYQDLMQPGERSFTKTLTLPLVMAAGPARYQAVVTRWCNRVQEYFWPMIDTPFPILFEVAR